MAQDKKGVAAKSFSKGEPLFKHGEPVGSLYLIQSGLVSLTVSNSGGKVEVYQATAPQVVGVEAICGAKIYETSAFAKNDTTAIELPARSVARAIDQCVPSLKLLVGGFLGKFAAATAELRALRLEGDPTPCPPALTGKLFATVFHVVSYTATKKGEQLRIVWPAFRKYCQRVFAESPVRLEQLIYLLANMGLAELEMVKSDTEPDGPEELGFVRFKDIAQLESFSEFFRIRLKTLGPERCMDLADPSLQAGEVLHRAYGTQSTDPAAKIEIPLEQVMKSLRDELGKPGLSANDLEGLIGRGLPVEIRPGAQGRTVRLAPLGLKMMFFNWRILAKIVDWNKKGRAPGAPEESS